MSETLERIRDLVASGCYAFSNHAYEELAADGILPREILAGLPAAIVVEDYPDAKRGPSVLVFWRGENGDPLHAVWGVHASNADRAILITVYRPNPKLWTPDYLKRLRP
ncbi:DUF4258 domain-containing protein [Kumtagia ephedrae]|uniref:DUF4258 domain-containing protein n=1 Tax=Kumtagia ephedrae TaxID=2116701 RepID=A0A2P7STM1_9HYPH|nr:DUF4258 domain-containing protein [Mesorhizobium ephedrae]PSJ65826.1 hypothetical protein C7I84_01515 [Mesorhizobium ephedrae]